MRAAVWVLAVALGALALGQPAAGGRLEIFSWWTGEESARLRPLLDIYARRYPAVFASNAAGADAQTALRARMLAGDPPDAFQARVGQALAAAWGAEGRMEDLSTLYRLEGWNTRLPQGLLELLRHRGKIYSVPLSVTRTGLLWYEPARLRDWGLTVPKTWAEFLAACQALKGRGLAAPLALGDGAMRQGLWEAVALGVLGAADYARLWAGRLRFDDPRALKVWDTFGAALDCAGDDPELPWPRALDRVLEGGAAFALTGDWAAAYLIGRGLEPGAGFGWAPAPGTAGTFMMLAESFGVPRGAKNRAAGLNWLRLVGSREGQDAFNPPAGTLPPRTDADLSRYNTYVQSAARDWRSSRIVGSLFGGAVAPEAFVRPFAEVVEAYRLGRDAPAAAAAAQALARQARLGQ